MFFPIARAARMTAHAAIHDTGIGGPPRAGKVAVRLIRFPGHVRWTFALRNSFRRPWRLTAMLLGLASGGALLQMTYSNYESFMSVIDVSLGNQGHDIDVSMLRPAPAAELESIARRVPEVDIAEAWRRVGIGFSALNAIANPASEKIPIDQNRRLALTGFPANTQLFHLPLVRGRMPLVGSHDEIVVTRAALDQFSELQIDRDIELQYRERKHRVKIVGVVEQIAAPAIYAGFETFEAATALGDASSIVRLRAKPGQIELAVVALDRLFLEARRVPSQIISRAMVRDSLDEHFKVVGDVIRMVALAAALVGAIILAAGTILNVSERLREIGILRTLGAPPGRIRALFMAESGAIIALAVIIAVALAISLTLAMLNAAETRLLHVAVPLKFSWIGFSVLCSGAAIVLLAVWLALRHALKRSVRETLAYE
jgi:putative ABC transport system permease protein